MSQTPAPATKATKAFVPQIETLRVAAMIGVFLYHAWSVAPGWGGSSLLGQGFEFTLSLGYLGVVLFNTVTGFVLALPHLGPNGRPMLSYPDFFLKRFGRICPAYFIALILWTVAGMVLAPSQFFALLRWFIEHLFFVHTLDPANFFGLVPAFWWLGLLAQAYLTFPLVFRLFRKFGIGRSTLWTCVGCWGFWLALSLLAKAEPGGMVSLVNYMWFFNLPARLPEFVMGIYLADRFMAGYGRVGTSPEAPRGDWGNAGMFAGVGVAILLAGAELGLTGLPLAHVKLTLACWAFMLAAHHMPGVAFLGTLAPVQQLSAAAYAIYLMHQPILGYMGEMMGKRFEPLTAFVILCVVGWPLSRWAARKLDRAAERVAG